MKFEPLNRHLVLEPIEKEVQEKQSTILVPDSYVQNKTPHETYKVVSISRDCEKMVEKNIGQYVVVDNGMVEKIKVHETTYYLLLENYVYGTFY